MLSRAWGSNLGRSLRVRWAPSLVRRVLRHRLTWALVASGAVALAMAEVADLRNQIRDAQIELGETVEVVVVADSVAAGDEIDGSLTLDRRPVGQVPDGALTSMPGGGVARVDLHRGEVVVGSRLVGLGRAASVVGARPVVAVVPDGAPPPVGAGDFVDLWAVEAIGQPGRRVASAAAVVGVSDGGLTVAVDPDEVATLVGAMTRPLIVVHVG